MADKSTTQTDKKKTVRGRIFNCLQYEFNPKTGACLNFTEANILDCVKHNSIVRYAYIRHDKDTITEADIETGRGSYTEADLGKPKGAHWHIVLETPNHAYPASTIAKWLGIPENMVEIPKGRGAFIDCVEYLRHSDIHQTLKGKYEYGVDEVKANFNWQAEVEALVLRKTKYERPLSEKEYVKNRVLYEGMTIGEVIDNYPTLYQEEMATILKLRTEYLNRKAPLPPFRVNYYIYGNSGTGKDTMAHSLAKALFPDMKYDDDVYFEIGSKKVTFSGYDGQPVIIWSEFRADTFVEALGGYEDVLGTIDIIPKNKREHKKYGDIRLVNAVNIVTSTQDFRDFLRGLVEEDDPDPTQANRRFPIIIPIHADYFDILLNEGYMGGDAYSEYRAWRQVTGSFGKLAKNLNSRPDLFQRAEQMLSTHAVSAHNMIVENIKRDPYAAKSDDEVIALLQSEGFGDYLTADEIKAKERDEFLDDMAAWESECFDKLVDFAHWFWDDFTAQLNREQFYQYLDTEDKSAYQKGFLKDMDFDIIKRAVSGFGAEEMILRYNERVIRGAIEMAWMGDL